jgi:hypothetical protein
MIAVQGTAGRPPLQVTGPPEALSYSSQFHKLVVVLYASEIADEDRSSRSGGNGGVQSKDLDQAASGKRSPDLNARPTEGNLRSFVITTQSPTPL